MGKIGQKVKFQVDDEVWRKALLVGGPQYLVLNFMLAQKEFFY